MEILVNTLGLGMKNYFVINKFLLDKGYYFKFFLVILNALHQIQIDWNC